MAIPTATTPTATRLCRCDDVILSVFYDHEADVYSATVLLIGKFVPSPSLISLFFIDIVAGMEEKRVTMATSLRQLRSMV